MYSLGHLADQLPLRSTTHLQLAEAELQAAFKASAQSLVTLLKAAQNTSKKGVHTPLLLGSGHTSHRTACLDMRD